ncbi:recombinase family protein [Roseiarcaceae bacterium H3SJ34-1]|uniref:recombinase family protein n=1 Tax=Terripilifer ovatus TaxID=3032367 RepID=UPI003AB96185|nr:recombinase family protein [Roseiarcaceae bacterium H3SJ34-1]
MVGRTASGKQFRRPPNHPQRAAQYLRMSTDLQEYSTELQAAGIQRYADLHNITIVQTYADEGKSGLNLGGRLALQNLIDDVTNGRAEFDLILVYDVSRWGRFQNADEAAHLEYICRQSGISIEYCAEQFENDGSISATIIKTVKRAMAGEYSRELSSKVFAGQCRQIARGYRQGGLAGYGLNRLMVDSNRQPKSLLAIGEHKSLQTDRVILVPGPPNEVENVRLIYRQFVISKRNEREIAALLNASGAKTHVGTAWSRGTVHEILTNEKYIGHNVYNRRSFKLKIERVKNAADQIVRANNAFEAIVDRSIFEQAQRIIEERSRHLSDEEMLSCLAQLLTTNNVLSALIIDERDDMPASSSYRHRFGSLINAYKLVGFTPRRDFRYIETNRFLRTLHPGVVTSLITDLRGIGASVDIDDSSDLLTINGEFTASVVLSRCCELARSKRWKIRFDTSLMPDITIVLRMNSENSSVLDYYLLPRLEFGRDIQIRLADENEFRFEAYRYETLGAFLALASRAPVRRAA